MLMLMLVTQYAWAQGSSCDNEQDCVDNNATSHYNFARCVNGTCTCLTYNGFSGDGNSESPCQCDYQVYWGKSEPFCKECNAPDKIYYDEEDNPRCVDLTSCESGTAQATHQKAVVTQLYENLIFPMPLMIMQNPSLIQDLFSNNVSGRITPVGVFDDLEGTVEYFYALASNIGGKVQDVNIIDLTSEGSTVSIRVDILFNSTDVSGVHFFNLTETGFFHFDDEGRILEYDLSILRLGLVGDPITTNHSLYIGEICQVSAMYCDNNSTTKQYNSTMECIEFLSAVPFGTWYNAMSNSVVCRIIHTILVPFRPQIHCPHIGPLGGMVCVDFTYGSFYEEPFF